MLRMKKWKNLTTSTCIPLNFFLAFFPGGILYPVGHHISVLPDVVLKLLEEKYNSISICLFEDKKYTILFSSLNKAHLVMSIHDFHLGKM